jgi:hypothetical protein
VKPILQEVHNEVLSGRLSDPKYYGVVFAHKSDHNALIKVLQSTLKGSLSLLRDNSTCLFKYKSGAGLMLRDEGCDIPPITEAHYNHAGLQYTTVILSYKMLYDENCNRVENPIDFINYMQSRLRSQSKHYTRMVMCP